MMNDELYVKLKQLLDLVEREAEKPLEDYNYEVRIWSKGYQKAMITIKDYIWNIFNSSN